VSEQPEFELARRTDPHWWDVTRRIIIFLLGVVCILYALFTPGNNIGTLACGLVLVGVLPVSEWLVLRPKGK